jgi:hypothetical protein
MQAVNGDSGGVATRRASKIDTNSRATLQAGLPLSHSCTVTPGQAATPTLAAVKTAIRRDKKRRSGRTPAQGRDFANFSAKLT